MRSQLHRTLTHHSVTVSRYEMVVVYCRNCKIHTFFIYSPFFWLSLVRLHGTSLPRVRKRLDAEMICSFVRLSVSDPHGLRGNWYRCCIRIKRLQTRSVTFLLPLAIDPWLWTSLVDEEQFSHLVQYPIITMRYLTMSSIYTLTCVPAAPCLPFNQK